MEIESKFLVLDQASFQAIEKLSQIGDYSFSDTEIQFMDDTFFDTEDKAIMAAGYYLRVRKILGKAPHWVTIKSLGGFEEGVHRREEYVCSLKEGVSILECPDLRMRNRIFEFTAGMKLAPLLSLKQKRLVRQVKLGEKHIAELSLDRVNLNSETQESETQDSETQESETQKSETQKSETQDSETQEKIYCELEVELKKGASAKDLENIRSFLLDHYNLAENSLSKFERAFISKEQLPKETFLNLRERAFCMQLAGQPDTYGKQAEILLALDQGLSEKEITLLLKVSEPEIKAVKSRFEKESLSIFPFLAEKEIKRTEEQDKKTKDFQFLSEAALAAPFYKGWKDPGFGEWTLETLFEYYGVDSDKAKKSAASALKFYDELALKGFGSEDRTVLELAVLLQDIGNLASGDSASQEEKIRIGKEILLTHPLNGLKLQTLRMLALVLELQNPALSEKAFISTLKTSDLRLPPGLLNKTLMLATLIRTAEALETEKTERKIEKKTALWRQVFGTKVFGTKFLCASTKDRENEKKKESKDKSKKARKKPKFTVKPEDSMSKLAPMIFSYQFSRMLSNEKGIMQRAGPEALHNMRVAIRRMQAASKVFEAYLDSKQLKPHLKGLKKTLGVLGEVRDLDVFQGKAENYLKTLPLGHEHELDPLFSVFAEEKKKAWENLLDYLNSEKYGCFKTEFLEFLTVPEAWILPTSSEKHEALPHRVKDVLPAALYARFATISAYSEWVEGPYVSIERLHRLRIAAKGMRYALEFFEDVLGKDAKPIIKEFKTFQDYLGDLHDTVVAIELLETYLRTGNWPPLSGSGEKRKEKLFPERKELFERKELLKRKELPEGFGGVEAYLEYKEAELQDLLNAFPEAWAKIRNREFKQQFEKIIGSLY